MALWGESFASFDSRSAGKDASERVRLSTYIKELRDGHRIHPTRIDGHQHSLRNWRARPAPATTDAEANNHPDPHRPLQYSLNGLGLAVREILGEVGFRELMQRGAKSGVFHLETR